MKLKRLVTWILHRPIQKRIQVKRSSEYHGSDYGGWLIHTEGLSSESLVYSFGVGEDISFDLSLIEMYGVQVYAFDPTPRSIHWVHSQAAPDGFHFFPYGIGGQDGRVRFYPPENPEHVSYTIIQRPTASGQIIEIEVYRLSTIMEMLGHQRIDVLKMDIEGAEYEVVQDIMGADIDIQQILIEFHHRFDGLDMSHTRAAIKLLNTQGYRIYAISDSGNEYSLIRV